MKPFLFVTLCTLCLFNLRIFITPDGECVRIETDDNAYPCTDEIKRDTGCWNENDETQLCSASWIQVES